MLLAGFALVWLTLLAVYGIRVALAGRFAHERAKKEPGSPFLGRFLIEFGYWAFSPLQRLCRALGVTPNQLTAGRRGASMASMNRGERGMSLGTAAGEPPVVGHGPDPRAREPLCRALLAAPFLAAVMANATAVRRFVYIRRELRKRDGNGAEQRD